jgi:hypothetical protein
MDYTGVFADELRKFILCLCLLHGIIRQKNKYSGFGWANDKYDFSSNYF